MTDFSLQICEWYGRNKRNLPWRETKNPYFIWLSEIILQQTRVDQGLKYYLKFVKNYPSIQELANAHEQDILNDWQGLGYYSRARNLHFAAKEIVNKHNGIFPNNYKDIISLKGIGEYTAAAIASFSFNLPHAVIDGNVFRVLSRMFDVDFPIDSTNGKKIFIELAQSLLPTENPAIHNQAIMEFGALQCTPQNPDCENCVLQINCLSFKNKTVNIRPIKEGKTKVRKRFFTYFILSSSEQIILRKRTEKDIWMHMFEFPKIENVKSLKEEEITEICLQKFGKYPFKIIETKKHILSHQHIFAKFAFLELENLSKLALTENEIVVQKQAISDYPIPRLIDRFLDEYII